MPRKKIREGLFQHLGMIQNYMTVRLIWSGGQHRITIVPKYTTCRSYSHSFVLNTAQPIDMQLKSIVMHMIWDILNETIS